MDRLQPRRAIDALTDAATTLRRRLRTPLGRRIARRRVGAWVLAVGVASMVGGLLARAESTERRWGATSEVLVATGDLRAGDPVSDDDVEVRSWPSGLVPDGALDHLPPGRRLAHPLREGEPVVVDRLARPGAGSAAARLDGRSAAVSVPLGTSGPPLQVGDRVDVMAAAAAAPDSWETPGIEVVARSAEVIELGEGHATLVVDRDEVEAAAAAILTGEVTVALIG